VSEVARVRITEAGRKALTASRQSKGASSVREITCDDLRRELKVF
jgi:hypothetical protein